MGGITITVKENKKGVVTTILNDPLSWWRKNERALPLAAKLAHRKHAIPATSAQSECLFSLARLVTKTRNH
ncbi:unnamed protein product [Sphacelaria rigidula]